MDNSTPFFKAFGPLLFGKPPVNSIEKILAEIASCPTLSQLRATFGAFIPHALLAPTPSGKNSRQRIFSLDVVFWAFLEQVQNPASSCREAVRRLIAFASTKLRGQKQLSISANTAAYCKARARIPIETLDHIHQHLAERMDGNIPTTSLWHGRKVRLVDGTGVSMPDTPSNQERWPQSSSQQSGCGFPLIKLVGLFCMHSGALLRAAYDSIHTHESRLFQRLWDVLEKGDLLVADRGFFSFSAIASLLARSVDSLIRLPENKLRIAIGQHLPKTDTFDVVIEWKRPKTCPKTLAPEEFEQLPASIQVRVVRYRIAIPGWRSQLVTIVTTLLDKAIASGQFAALYARRWQIELHFREIKIHLHMDVLRCMTAEMIERELRMHFIAYNLIRCIMQKAALLHLSDLSQLSFKGTLDTVRQFANAIWTVENKPRLLAALIEQLLLVVACDWIACRPNRVEPRRKKRRPKNYPLLNQPRSQYKETSPVAQIPAAADPKTVLS